VNCKDLANGSRKGQLKRKAVSGKGACARGKQTTFQEQGSNRRKDAIRNCPLRTVAQILVGRKVGGVPGFVGKKMGSERHRWWPPHPIGGANTYHRVLLLGPGKGMKLRGGKSGKAGSNSEKWKKFGAFVNKRKKGAQSGLGIWAHKIAQNQSGMRQKDKIKQPPKTKTGQVIGCLGRKKHWFCKPRKKRGVKKLLNLGWVGQTEWLGGDGGWEKKILRGK